ncbi:hypothetical protein HSR121_2196 [Halapricum desulfuricans]|uniref:Uncharacterized protein n=1 Tax=Halapricum desulfuricans TaxID=2841257 RepID=A0A897N808_9EURY|nr:hypothetical protein HSR121_2196 [Halapricum desulfuricans]
MTARLRAVDPEQTYNGHYELWSSMTGTGRISPAQLLRHDRRAGQT